MMRPGMTKEELAEFLRSLVIVGFEGEGGTEDEESSDDDSDDEEDEDEGGEDEEDSDLTDEEKSFDPKAKEALRKERKARRDAEKKAKEERRKRRQALKDARKTRREGGKKDDDKNTSEVDRIKAEKEEAEQKATRLHQRLRTQALDSVILKQAQKLGFRDVDDAVRLIDRSDDMVDGEDEDIEVDEDSVTDALEELAQRKPHLMREDEDEDKDRRNGKTGSKFGGRRKNQDGLTEQQLREKYPALRQKTPTN